MQLEDPIEPGRKKKKMFHHDKLYCNNKIRSNNYRKILERARQKLMAIVKEFSDVPHRFSVSCCTCNQFK